MLITKLKPTVSIINDNAVYLLDVVSRKEIRRLVPKVSGNPELAAAISARANSWDADTGKEFPGFGGGFLPSISTLTISPDGNTLALATGGYHPNPDTLARIHVFDLKTMKQFHVLDGHLQRICSLSFSADSQALFSASRDGTGLVWDLRKSNDSFGCP